MSFTLLCCFSRRISYFALTNPLSPDRHSLRSTLPLLRIFRATLHSTLPCPVLTLTPDLCPAPVCAALPSKISLLYHLHTIILPSLSLYPARPAPATGPPSFTEYACALFTMSFLPSNLPYLLPSALPVSTF